MSPSKLLVILACLLCLAHPAFTQDKPNGNRSSSTENRSSESSRHTDDKNEKVGGKTLSQWLDDLRNPDPKVRKDAILALVQLPSTETDFTKVLERLRNADGDERVRLINFLLMMRIPNKQRTPVFKELGRCLIDPSSEGVQRYAAAQTLLHLMRYRFGPPQGDERKIIMDLVQVASSSRNNEVREICIDAITEAGPDPKKGPDPRVTDALILRATPFREPAESVRYKAIMALGALGRPQDPKNLEKVVAILKNAGNSNSKNRIIKMWTHVSLMALDEKIPKKELDNIVKMLEDPETHIKIQAVTALGALRDKAHAYVGDVCDMAKRELAKKDKDAVLLAIVAQAMGRMGNKGYRVISTLLKIAELNDREYVSAVVAACQALKELGVNDARTIQALEKLLKHPSLEANQKAMLNEIIEEIKNPPKKPLKVPPKVTK